MTVGKWLKIRLLTAGLAGGLFAFGSGFYTGRVNVLGESTQVADAPTWHDARWSELIEERHHLAGRADEAYRRGDRVASSELAAKVAALEKETSSYARWLTAAAAPRRPYYLERSERWPLLEKERE